MSLAVVTSLNLTLVSNVNFSSCWINQLLKVSKVFPSFFLFVLHHAIMIFSLRIKLVTHYHFYVSWKCCIYKNLAVLKNYFKLQWGCNGCSDRFSLGASTYWNIVICFHFLGWGMQNDILRRKERCKTNSSLVLINIHSMVT